MTIPTKNNFEMNASGPNELKVSYICIGNTQFSQYFDTMMSLCCLICTDEITKSTKLQKLTPPPPPVYATNDFNWKCGLHIDWVVRTFISSFSLLPTPPPPGPRYSFLHLPFSQSSPSPSGPSPPFLKSPLPITFSPFLLPYMPKICSIASKLFLFMKIQIFHILPGDLTVRSESYFLCGCLYATPI